MLSDAYEEIISVFQRQLKNHVRFTSLKELCVRKVAESLPSYAKQRLTKLSSVLPKTLCSEVYEECLQSCEDDSNGEWKKKWRDCDLQDKINLFAGNGLEEFDCRILSMDSLLPYGHRQPFEHLARESPKLKSLLVHCFYGSYREEFGVQLLSEYFSLDTMSSLVVLEIKSYPVKDADLKVIGSCLLLLQRLMLYAPNECGVLNSIISLQALEYLKNLTFLKHLTFIVNDNDHVESVQLVKNCLQLMPKVNTVGKSFAGGLYFVPLEFPSFEAPVELGLEHLVLGKNTVIPSNVTLPNVTRITCFKSLNVSLKQFKKLRHLSFMNLYDWGQLMQTLSEVGHLLKTLALYNMSSYKLNLQVLQLCPNLEELILHEVKFEDYFQVSQLKNCVQNLKIFKHEFDDSEDSFDSNGLLHLLLTSCPELEELQLHEIGLSAAELDLINDEMIADTLSIQKLQNVEISAVVIDQVTLIFLAQFACKLCVLNYDILENVDIDESVERENILPIFEVALKMQDCVNNKRTILK